MKPVEIFENAHVVTSDSEFAGYVAIQEGRILEVGQGRAPERGVDLGGDLLIPGLVEIHTDNLEAHFMPRPKVLWQPMAAVLAYDAQIATSGITTVFDSLRIGVDEHETRQGFGAQLMVLADAIAKARDGGHLRADHLTHIRCEVPAPQVVADFAEFLTRHPVHLISLMDHTPGQRQFRDIEKYFIYYGGKTGKNEDDIRALILARQAHGGTRAAANRPQIVALAKQHGIAIASHDDTTLEDVAQSITEGVTIAEFPTTIESAVASRDANLANVMGAPNVVRGGSHSGNVAARDLAEMGVLDVLSSDYVPGSLIMAAFALSDMDAVGGLPGAIRLVTKNPADATGLADRGEIAVGKRADLVRVRLADGHPVIGEVWREGRRVA